MVLTLVLSAGALKGEQGRGQCGRFFPSYQQSSLLEHSCGYGPAGMDLCEFDHGEGRCVFLLEIYRARYAHGSGREMISSRVPAHPSAKQFGRFSVALLGSVGYGKPNLIITERCADGHEGIWLNLGSLLGSEIVKLDKQGGGRAWADDDVMLVAFSLVQNAAYRAVHFFKASAGTLKAPYWCAAEVG